MKTMLAVVGSSLLWSAIAAAEPRFADEWYKEGEDRYNLGKFDEAADAFKRGFELEPNDGKKPAYIYNVAQAYRQANKCKDAQFFYKRFLALKDSGMGQPLSNDERKQVDALVDELDACAKTPPTATAKAAGEEEDDGDDDGDREARTPIASGPKLVVASVELGGAMLHAGSLDVPLQPAFSLVVGHPIAVDARLRVDVGVAICLMSLPYTDAVTNQSEPGSMTWMLANGGATYAVAPRIGVRGDIGLGAMLLGGADRLGNPYTPMGEQTTGALAMFALRAAISGDYELTPNLVGTVTPLAFTYSPGRSGLRSDITSITSFQLLIGLGYRI